MTNTPLTSPPNQPKVINSPLSPEYYDQSRIEVANTLCSLSKADSGPATEGSSIEVATIQYNKFGVWWTFLGCLASKHSRVEEGSRLEVLEAVKKKEGLSLHKIPEQVNSMLTETPASRSMKASEKVINNNDLIYNILCLGNLSVGNLAKFRQVNTKFRSYIDDEIEVLGRNVVNITLLKARNGLYKNKEFKLFLDQNKIFGNIYGSENQKKIILELLEKIKTTTDNDEEKTQFQVWLSTYLKGCDSLDLSSKRISNHDLNVIAKLCPHLQSINLSWTGITDAGLGVLSNLKSLESLYLSSCIQVTKEGLGKLVTCPKLKTLDLSECTQIKNDCLSVLSNLKSLESLDLGYCVQITNLSPLSNLKSLKSLNLGGTFVAEVNPLMNFEQLKFLDLSYTGVTDVSSLTKCANLEKLHLGYCDQITNLSVLSNLKSLKSLYLVSCDQITDADLNLLSNLKSLESLYLSNCSKITNLSPLSGLKNLKSLILFRCNQITDECVNNLKDQLPNLQITR